jgi:hypothetical protein
LTTISAFFKVISSALARASMSCALFIPLYSFKVCAEALTGAGEPCSSRRGHDTTNCSGRPNSPDFFHVKP